MSQEHMTRWIELADERRFFEAAQIDCLQEFGESHFLHLGSTMVKISSWIQRGIHPRSFPVAIH